MKGIKRACSLLLAAVLLVTSVCAFSFSAFADELRYFERGILTDGTYTAYYVIDKDNQVLYITGDGNNYASTPDYPSADQGPFAGRTDVTRIVIEEDVARVGDYALSNMTKVDTLEVQSNLLSSSSSMSSKAMIGCTGLRHIQGDSALLSTDVFLQVVKGALNIASGNWLSLIANGVSIISTGVNGDDSLDDETVHCMVDDYINNGNKIFLGDLEQAKEAYNERLANPCYSNNAFHHTYSSAVTSEPTCTQAGVTTHTCTVCNNSYTTDIPALGHIYVDSVLYQPSCFVEGIMKHACTRCGNAVYEAIAPYGHHSYDVLNYDAQADAYTEVCTVCGDENTDFGSDISALIAAADMTEAVEAEDYTPASYNAMVSAAERYMPLSEGDTLQYPQAKVDEKTAEILTRIDELVPYLHIRLSSDLQTPSIAFDDVTGQQGSYHAVFGTEITLTAQPAEGYTFKGWYEKITKRFLSDSEIYTFPLTSNMDIRAVYASADYATLTFLCQDGQTKAYTKKTVAEWNSLDSLASVVPEVPYSYGRTGGRWEYDEAQVLAALRSGNDVTLTVVYDAGEPVLPEKPLSNGTVPELMLYYDYDSEQNIGNFIMAGDIPDGCAFQEIGIAFRYGSSDTFRPDAFRLTINNKMLTSKFLEKKQDGIYIVNFKKMKATDNYAARGYVSYLDAQGNLKIVYSNQINIIR